MACQGVSRKTRRRISKNQKSCDKIVLPPSGKDRGKKMKSLCFVLKVIRASQSTRAPIPELKIPESTFFSNKNKKKEKNSFLFRLSSPVHVVVILSGTA
jgi:hypothetical protein